jgi:hypothetical protein
MRSGCLNPEWVILISPLDCLGLVYSALLSNIILINLLFRSNNEINSEHHDVHKALEPERLQLVLASCSLARHDEEISQ